MKPIQTPRVADVVRQQLETMILEGVWKAGHKLPTERALAEQFGVSRPTVRAAIQALAARGMLTSRQGGGTYVNADPSGTLADSMLDLFGSHPEFQYDLLEFRHALEGLSAYYAALRSTETDRTALQQRFDALIATYEAQDPILEAEADAAFHLAIAEAAHNVVLLHSMRALFSMLERSIVDNLRSLFERKESRETLYKQHKALLDAILAGDAERAQQMSHEHLVYVEEGLLELSKTQTRVQRALRRAMTPLS
ncbi:MAG: FCD domain-containing protein [Natronospirillum sp.]